MKMMPRHGGRQMKQMPRYNHISQIQKQFLYNHHAGLGRKQQELLILGSDVNEQYNSKRLYSTFSEKIGTVLDVFGISNDLNNKNNLNSPSDKNIGLLTGASEEDKKLMAINNYNKFKLAFEDMKKNGIPLTVVTYNILLHRCGRMSKVDEVDLYFNEMKLKKIKPNVITYNILINRFSRSNEINKVEKYLNEMKSNNIEPDCYTYNILISAYGKNGNFAKIDEYLSEMKSNNVKQNIVTHNTLVNLYGKHGDFAKVDECLQEMKLNGIKPNHVTYNTLTRDKLRKGNKMGGNFNFQTCTEVTSSDNDMILRKIRRYKNIILAFEDMKKRDISITTKTYGIVLNRCAKSGNLEDTKKYFNEMKEAKNLEPDVYHYNSLLYVLGKKKQFEEVEMYVSEMKKNGISLNSHIYNTLLVSYGKNKSFKKVKNYLKEMKKNGVEQDQFIKNTLNYIGYKENYNHKNEYIKSLEKQIEAKDSDISKLETIHKKHRQYITNLEEVKTPTQREKKALKRKKPKDRKVDKRSSFISSIKDIF